MKTLFEVMILLCLIPAPITARRGAPQAVAPLFNNNIKYSAIPQGLMDMDTFNAGGVQATDSATGKILWTQMIYELKYITGMERENSWVFIDSMALDNTKEYLLIKNERGDLYKLHLLSQRVIHVICR